MSKAYVISDLHFGHRGITKFRKDFASREEHDEYVVESILRTVSKRDTLWLLGDCFFDRNTYKLFNRIALRCDFINFIPGNHDTDNNERVELFKQMVNDRCFNKVGSMFNRDGMWLTHCPIHPAELFGKINVHGHVHHHTVRDDRYVNVCAENIRYVPVELYRLKDKGYCREVLIEYGPEETENV